MPLTPAEKQKLYRERLKERDPDKYLVQKRKNAERSKEKRKKISDYAPSEQETIRKQWRERKNKNKDKLLNVLPEVMPTTSHAQEEKKLIYRLKNENRKLQQQNFQLKITLKNYRKKIKRCIKKNNELLEQLENKDKLIKNFKVANDKNFEQMTPYSKTEAYIEQNLPDIHPNEKDRIKKTLFEHHALVDTIKQGYQTENMQTKRILKNIMNKSEVLDRYKMKTKMATFLGLKGRIRHSLKKRRNSVLQNLLKSFFVRDDVSKITAGRKETKTFRKQKKQKRYLLGTLRKLYQKYSNEGGKLSFATFKRYRPFYVLPPKVEKRETCACKRHQNLELKAAVLNKIGLIPTKDLDELLAMIVCDPKSSRCCYGECELCKNKQIYFTVCTNNLSDTFSWDEWVLKSHEYKSNSNETKTIKKMVKEQKSGSLQTLLYLFQEEIQNFKTHSYNIFHQYREYRRCIENLDEHTIVLHIDFSENYACKLSTEIQAMHFGGSRQQITLHTGIMYTAKGRKSFASISGNNNHGPDAIWAHLLPVIKLIREKFTHVDGIHYFSDGPTVQYRQKKIFYYFTKITKEHNFKFSTWNFFEASHGKGAADGVGGAIKRKLDSFVAYGSDVPDAEIAYKLLLNSETNIKLFYVPDETELTESPDLLPIPNTMKLHQIINIPDSDNCVSYRNLSCFCRKSRPGFCECFNVKSHLLLKPTSAKTNKINASVKKVIILSDIRNTEENRSYFDLKNYGPFNLQELENIAPSDDITYKNRRKRNLEAKNKKVVTKKTKKYNINYESSSDDDMIYSIHDSSIDENFISDNESSFDDEIQEVEKITAKQKTQNIEEIGCTNYKIMDKNEQGINNENKKIMELNSTEELMWASTIQQIDANDNAMKLQTPIESYSNKYKNGDIVIIRYYERGSWKYYIGFIKKILYSMDEIHYTIDFLKTVKQPTLKFIIPRLKDKDTVTEKSIVKTIEITQSTDRPREYYLAADSDSVYFN